MMHKQWYEKGPRTDVWTEADIDGKLFPDLSEGEVAEHTSGYFYKWVYLTGHDAMVAKVRTTVNAASWDSESGQAAGEELVEWLKDNYRDAAVEAPKLKVDDVAELIQDATGAAHHGEFAEHLGHSDGFCIACAETYRALSIAVINFNAARDE